MQFSPNPSISTLASYQLADLSVPDGQTLISLAQNELCFSPSDNVCHAAQQAMQTTQLYPDPDWHELCLKIADRHNINHQNILCGAGSMELLEVFARCYLSSDDHALMSQYSYSFFKTVTQMYGAQLDVADETNYCVDTDLLLKKVTPKTKVVFIANPGNPTGTIIPAQQVLDFRRQLPDHVFLILDQAYAEFIDTSDHNHLFELVESGNTCVLRTFSKIYGLAGMRVSWGYFPADIHATMRKALNPNNISAVSQAAACAALDEPELIEQRKESINSIKTEFCNQLTNIGLNVIPSHTNFVLIEFSSEQQAKNCFSQLQQRGIIMRPMGALNLTNCLRATISSEENMHKTITALKQIFE